MYWYTFLMYQIVSCYSWPFIFERVNFNRFTVAESLTHLAATLAMLEVTGSRPSFCDISEIRFLESIQYPAHRDLKWSM